MPDARDLRTQPVGGAGAEGIGIGHEFGDGVAADAAATRDADRAVVR